MKHFLASAALAVALALPLPAVSGDLDNLQTITNTYAAPTPMDAQTLYWLEVAQTGLYSISLDRPGLLRLYVFDNEDGSFDGTQEPRPLRETLKLYTPPVLDNVLLPAGSRYLLLATPVDTASLGFTLQAPFEGIVTPEDGMVLPEGTSWHQLYRFDDNLEFIVPPSDTRVKLEAIIEPRGEINARLDYMYIRPGGAFPLLLPDGGELGVSTDMDAGPPPVLLLRMTPYSTATDEYEPNSDYENGTAQTYTIGNDFNGALLNERDEDAFEFEITAPQTLSIDITTQAPWLEFNVTLEKNIADRWEVLADRDALGGTVVFPALGLGTGNYRLTVIRNGDPSEDVAYTLTSALVAPPATGHEQEPNDTLIAATPLPDGNAVRGELAEDNYDFFSFNITTDGHLWRLFGVRGVERLYLRDAQNNIILDQSSDTGRITMDTLALSYGKYTVEARGEGTYALKLMDLGPAPVGYEAEPNDDPTLGRRVTLGQTYRGTFLDNSDFDYYVFRLDAATTITLDLAAPDDGILRALLNPEWAGEATIAAGETYSYSANLPAGDYSLRLRGREDSSRGTYGLTVSRSATKAVEPDHLPQNLRAAPLNGDISDSVGMMDEFDQIHIVTPEGSGQIMAACRGSSEFTWRMYSYVDEEQISYARAAPVILPYSPELGGAIRMQIDGYGDIEIPYNCAIRFAPTHTLANTLVASEGNEPLRVLPGTHVSGWLADDRDRDTIIIDYPENTIGAYICRDEDGVPFPSDTYLADMDEISEADEVFENGVAVFRATYGYDTPPTLELRGDYAPSHPFAWACDFYGADDMPSLGDMGHLAEFTALELRKAEGQEAPLVALPPILQTGRPDWIAQTESGGDLAIEISLQGFEAPFATYAQTGQQADITLTLTNTGTDAISGHLNATMLAEGWRVSPDTLDIDIPAKGSAEVAIALTAPPMLSPTLEPALAINVTGGLEQSGEIFEVPLALDAAPRRPVTYWSPPSEILGGLNVLHHTLGARITHWNGEEMDADEAQEYAYIHDGLAPHSGTRGIDGRELVFALAEETPIAGAMFQLRSTETRDNWPDGYEIALSMDGTNWQVAADGRISASMKPQYVTFNVTAARFMRLRTSGCQGDPACGYRFVLPEVALLAKPGWQLSTPFNIADPDRGGHVVYSNDYLGSNWNAGLLNFDTPRTLREQDERWPNIVTAIIAFDQSRAAHIGRIVWENEEVIENSFPEVSVFASLTGPDGPWLPVGVLPAPKGDNLRTELVLDTPAWARFIKLEMLRSPDEYSAVPDKISIFEAQGSLSIMGLWEDDAVRGPYEFTNDIPPASAVEPIGGATQETAASLRIGSDITSSVLIERNEDWWSLTIPEGLPRELTLDFSGQVGRPEYVWSMIDSTNAQIPFTPVKGQPDVYSAILGAGEYWLNVNEPPRSIIISWDTSGSVSAYIPKTLEAVRIWSQSLIPGRDVLQLLPFGSDAMYLPDWATTPEEVAPYLSELPSYQSSDSEAAMMTASQALMDRDGARGIVIITDAENSFNEDMWGPVLQAAPRVISLSVDSSDRQNATVMLDWAAINGGMFHRVVGVVGLADGLEMAAALFRAPKPYTLTANLAEIKEPTGEGTLTIMALIPDIETAAPTGGIEVILDASGSMLKRMANGERRIAVAHEALTALVRDSLPEGTPFAFRAFGLEKDACRSELVLPLGPLDRTQAIAAINDVPAINLAKTAIAKSLLATREDLANATEPRVVVLVTDGEETCDGDVEQAIADLKAGGFDVRVNIVGFAIDDAELAANFAMWAEQGGGAYFEAREADALSDAIAEAIQPRFTVTKLYYDGTEELLMTIAAGEAVPIPAGRLRIEPATAAIGAPITFMVHDAENIQLDYNTSTGLEGP